MAHHRNLLIPDTCQCEIEFSFDDELPNDQIESSFELYKIHRKCKRHESLSDQEVYDTAWHDENKRKNFALGHIQEAHPELCKPNEKGEPELDMDKVKWSYDKNSVLRLDIPTLEEAKKDTTKSALDVKFGADKVVFD